ncbi:hypothetical protein BFJ63_vAg16123 [Fusarium oxysporum f. sp. narcissi]|uniref:Uncharacterized protein n=1 Tax=Fusarium oxysporum f. sp. narcissi TaxID=451672 RepID=A0A4V1RYB1_FUSOX|nr:hypothetical protein BFJ63_vAg16123 [Fusarium oxysporum f. sp. narcissi]
MDSLSMAYLEKFRFVQITRNWESYIVWVLRETDGHFVAEQLSACPNEYGEGSCLEVVSLVLPCCSSAPINVDGEQVFHHARLKSRSVSPPENSGPTVCCPNEHSPFSSPWPHPRNYDTLMQPYAHSATITETLPISQASESPSKNASATTPRLHERDKKRTSPNTLSQEALAKKTKLTTTQAASRLFTQLSASTKRGSCEQSVLPDDADITKRLSECQRLVKLNPKEVDNFVGELQLWLQQAQQRSSLHLAALQHLLACVDLYNWVNRNDKNTERNVNKGRWSEVQRARYRNMLANELCKTKKGTSDRLGLATLAPMTAKGLKFGHLQNAVDKDKTEIIQQFTALARPELEERLKNVRVIEATNPVSFVCWFLEKPYVVDAFRSKFSTNNNRAVELANICKALCFTELSVEDCYPSPTIWHKIRAPSTSEMFEDGESHSNGNAQGFHWLLQAADRSEETAQGGSYEEPVPNRAQLDNIAWNLSDLLDSEADRLGFN